MPMRFVALEVEHLQRLNVQPQQASELAAVNASGVAQLKYYGIAMAAVADDGRVLACGGLMHKWKGLGSVWALIARDIKPQEWVAVVRRVRSGLDNAHRSGTVRIEATADADYKPACRLLEMLGFDEPRVRLRVYSPLGRDCYLYARIRFGDPLAVSSDAGSREAAE